MVVAPHAGARIETACGVVRCASVVVAPHAGARIETLLLFLVSWWTASLPMRERELKLKFVVDGCDVLPSLPMRERELKLL